MHWASLQGTRMFPDWGADHATGKAVTCLQLPSPPLGLCSYNFPIPSSYVPVLFLLQKAKPKYFLFLTIKDQEIFD